MAKTSDPNQDKPNNPLRAGVVKTGQVDGEGKPLYKDHDGNNCDENGNVIPPPKPIPEPAPTPPAKVEPKPLMSV